MEGPSHSASAADVSSSRATFYRQSGWLMVANVASGVVMWSLHLLARQLNPGEYGVFGALLTFVLLLPLLPLQMVVAQQTAIAIAEGSERQLAGLVRILWLGAGGFWVLVAAVLGFAQDRVLVLLHIADPGALWLTLAACLFATWLAVVSGVLQGQQNILWLGWSLIANAAARVAVAAALMFAAGGHAAALLTGVLVGYAGATAVGLWQTSALWRLRPEEVSWRRRLSEAVPLLIGFGAFRFLFAGDTLFAEIYLGTNRADAYFAAGTLSRALVWLAGPLAMVMFPRIIRSRVLQQSSSDLRTTLQGTFVITIAGGAGLYLAGPTITRFLYPGYNTQVMHVLPWYVVAMVPLGLANVLLNDLFAKGSTWIAPFVAALALAYGLALTLYHDSAITVLITMAAFALVLLAGSAWRGFGSAPAGSSTLASGI